MNKVKLIIIVMQINWVSEYWSEGVERRWNECGVKECKNREKWRRLSHGTARSEVPVARQNVRDIDR